MLRPLFDERRSAQVPTKPQEDLRMGPVAIQEELVEVPVQSICIATPAQADVLDLNCA